ncbi:MAG: hypothetical protein B7Z67_14050 [Acidiphilium sp. 21-60-14]|uniref:hypothetical protein n=1 Tax=Acidiphilium sp. PA TaxID=2871705 RepID=UPI000BDB035F|nr:hypothetical protein [Acidiphilium sp. PA]MCW8308752.1 hypothetical protein [Acidiphilium sp. PA]OYV68226.1 MAG: hypothetical protein B7Z67_14050 [Acidiphilium sp. 21-60-14]
MSLYGEAIAAMRRIVLLDDRVTQLAEQNRDLTVVVQDLRDRVSRLEGMIAGMTVSPVSNRPRRLPPWGKTD